MKKKQGTIDLTPSWEYGLSLCLMVLRDGDKEGKKIAIEELTKMAKLADKYVRAVKDGKIKES